MFNAPQVRFSLWKQQSGVCHYCKRLMTMQSDHLTLMCTIDHVIPRAHGGLDVRSNIVGACTQCNTARGTLPADLFARYVRRFGLPNASRLGTSNYVTRKKLVHAAAHMLENGLSEPIINDVLRQKLETAIRAKIAILDAAPPPPVG